jgi:restriction endonuclease S subunit
VVENYKPRIEIDPEWEMVELSKVCEISSGGTPSRNIPEFWNGTIPWVGSAVCKDVEVTKAKEFITEHGLNKSAAKLFPEGTTLIALVGATIGKTGYLMFPCTTNQNIAGLSPKSMEILDKRYLFYIAQSLYPKFMELAEGKFRMANLSFIRTLKIPLPGIDIQQDIVKRIDSEKNIVKGNVDLIMAFKQKIKDRIAKVWGE